MAKTKTSKSYEQELKRMIMTRTGRDMEPWLLPQVRATAKNMVMLDKIQSELENQNTLMFTTSGSMSQTKSGAHPLLAHYDKLQRTLLQQFEALGLSYRTTPSKMTENTKAGGDEHDKLTSLLNDIKDV